MPQHSRTTRRSLACLGPTRHGVTLVEVMMSTMVVSLGILGLVSLIPLGTHLTERGTRADRVASLGERVYHEARIRGVFDPNNWVIPTSATTSNQGTFLIASEGLPVRQPYMIDPLFYGDNGTQGSRRLFPYPTSVGRTGGAAYNIRMPRITLRRNAGSVFPYSTAYARAVFQSYDDLAFERPDDGEVPSFQKFYVRTDAMSNDISLRRSALGEYSWMIMLTPPQTQLRNFLPETTTPDGTTHAPLLQPPVDLTAAGIPTGLVANAATDQYTAWIIITKKRTGNIPAGDVATIDTVPEFTSERVLSVSGFLSAGGFSTGEVVLTQTGGTLEEAEDETLKFSSGDWICLVARLPNGNGYPRGDVYQWYRIVMVDDIPETTPPFTRRLTISGPDWTANGVTPSHAIAVDGVVGVYQKRIRLETPSPWSP